MQKFVLKPKIMAGIGDGPHWFPGSGYLYNYNAQNELSLKFLRVLIFAGITLVSYLVLL